jgi:hypothetical protein
VTDDEKIHALAEEDPRPLIGDSPSAGLRRSRTAFGYRPLVHSRRHEQPPSSTTSGVRRGQSQVSMVRRAAGGVEVRCVASTGPTRCRWRGRLSTPVRDRGGHVAHAPRWVCPLAPRSRSLFRSPSTRKPPGSAWSPRAPAGPRPGGTRSTEAGEVRGERERTRTSSRITGNYP